MDHDIHAIADFVLDKATLNSGLDFHGIGPLVVEYLASRSLDDGPCRNDTVEDGLLRAVARRLVVAPDFHVQNEGDELQTSTALVLCDSADLSKSFEDLRLVPSEDRLWRTLCGHGVNYRLMIPEEFKLLVETAKAGSEGILQLQLSEVTGQHIRAVGFRTNNLMRSGYLVKLNCRYPANTANKTSRIWHFRFNADASTFEEQEQARETERRSTVTSAAASKASETRKANAALWVQETSVQANGTPKDPPHMGTGLAGHPTIDLCLEGVGYYSHSLQYQAQQPRGSKKASASPVTQSTRPLAPRPIAPRPQPLPPVNLATQARSSTDPRQDKSDAPPWHSNYGGSTQNDGFVTPTTPAFAHTPELERSSPYLGTPFLGAANSYHPRTQSYSSTLAPVNQGGNNVTSQYAPVDGTSLSTGQETMPARAQAINESQISPQSHRQWASPPLPSGANAPRISVSANGVHQRATLDTATVPTHDQHTVPADPIIPLSDDIDTQANGERADDAETTPATRKRKMSYRAQAAVLVKKRKLDLEAAKSPDQNPTENDLYVIRSLVLPTPSCRVFKPKKYIEQAEEVIRGRPQKKLMLVIKSARLNESGAFRRTAPSQASNQHFEPPHSGQSLRLQLSPLVSNNFFPYYDVHEASQLEGGHLVTTTECPPDGSTATQEQQMNVADPARGAAPSLRHITVASDDQVDAEVLPPLLVAPSDSASTGSRSLASRTVIDQPGAVRAPSPRSGSAITSSLSRGQAQSHPATTRGPTSHPSSYTPSTAAHTFSYRPIAQYRPMDSSPASLSGALALRENSEEDDVRITRVRSEVTNDIDRPRHVDRAPTVHRNRKPGSQLTLEILEKAEGVYPGDGQVWFPYATSIRRHSSTTPYRTTVDNIVNDLVGTGDLKNLPFTFEKKGNFVTKHILLLSTTGERSREVWKCKEAMIQSHPSKFFPEGPEVDPTLIANPHPNRRLLQKNTAASARSSVLAVPKQSTSGVDRVLSAPHRQTVAPPSGSSHLCKRKRTSSITQGRNREGSIDPADEPNEEQASLEATFQLDCYTHDQKAAPQGPLKQSNEVSSQTPGAHRALQRSDSTSHRATSHQAPRTGVAQPLTSASSQQKHSHWNMSFSTQAPQSSTRSAQPRTLSPQQSHASATVAAKQVATPFNFTWEADELTQAAFEQEVLREQQERDRPYQYGVEAAARVTSPTAWILDSQPLPAGHPGPFGRKRCVTLTDPDQCYHGVTGTFSTESCVLRDVRPKLKLQPDAQRNFEDTLPKDLKEMTKARRMRWLGRATDFERAVDAVAAWEEDNESCLTSAQSLMTPRFINHFVTDDEKPRPPKAPRLTGDASVAPSSAQPGKAGLSKTLRISGRKSMPSNRLVEAHDAEPLLQQRLQLYSEPSSEAPPPAAAHRATPVLEPALPPPQPVSASKAQGPHARPLSNVPLLPYGTDVFAKYKQVEGTIPKGDLLLDSVTLRIILAVIIVRTLVPNHQGNVHWPAVCRLVPDCGHSSAHNRWVYLKASQEKLINQCQNLFEKEYITACESGELPLIDFDDVESYCWDKLLEWACNKVEEAALAPEEIIKNVNEESSLPATREALAEEYEIDGVNRQDPDLPNGYLNVTSAAPVEAQTSPVQGLIHRPDQQRTPVVPSDAHIAEHAIALTLIRANILAPFASYSPQIARARLTAYPDRLLADAIAKLKDRGIIQTANKIAGKLQRNTPDGNSSSGTSASAAAPNLQQPGDPRTYIPDPAFVNMLDNAHGDSWSPSMLHEAAAYKQSLDKAFGATLSGYVDAPSSPSPGQMMVLTSLRENNEITSTPIVKPTVHFDGKIPLPIIRMRATSTYQQCHGLHPATPFNERIKQDSNPPAPHLTLQDTWTQRPVYDKGAIIGHTSHRNGQHLAYNGAQSKKERRIPPWYSINDVLMPEVFDKIVALVLYVVVMGDGVDVGDVVRGLRGKVERWDVEVVLEWLIARGKDCVRCEVETEVRRVYRAGKRWWSALGAGKASNNE